MKLAVYSSKASAYSETFIALQLERLQVALRVHGNPVAAVTFPGGAIEPLRTIRGLATTAWCVARGDASSARTVTRRAELIRRCRAQGIDRFLANFGPSAVDLVAVTDKLRVPLVVHFHGYDAHKNSTVDSYGRAYRDLGRKAVAIIAVSEGMVEALAGLGVPEAKIHLVRYGVCPSRFTPRERPPDDPTFFGVGRFVDKKAPYLTLLAFAKARRELPRAKLILAGDGELLEATKNLAVALSLGDSVRFPGVLSPDAVATQMRDATAYVQHSIQPLSGPSAGDREGTPVSILEAMMVGLPVIATRHAGIGEVVVDGRSGFLVQERDVDGMAAVMVSVGSSPVVATELGTFARQEALAKYTADQYIAALTAILEGAR